MKEDYAIKATESAIEDIESSINDVYGDAYAELKAKIDAYFEQYKERYEKEYRAWKAGAYTDEEFALWVQSQLGRGERWEAMADDIARRIAEANILATQYANGGLANIYALNHNYSAYRIEKAFKGADFKAYSENAIRNLIMNKRNVTEFRTLKTNPLRDYLWNKKEIDKALASAIIQGKPIGELTNSFLGVMKRNRNSAMRNARTASTSAQNAGRLQSFMEAKAMGIHIKKEWIAIYDSRTRDSHRHLDGQIKEIEELFDNGLLFPADTNGAPKEVYNCRCTMGAVLPEYEDDESTDDYQDWLKRKEKEEAQKKQ